MSSVEFMALPESGPRAQLIDGTLVMSPSPSRNHQELVGTLYAALRDYGQRSDRGSVWVAPLDVFLDEHNVVQPDVIWVARPHLDRVRDDGIHGAPDLCVEVLSPTSAWLDKKRKTPLYSKHGVTELWLVDPLLEQVQLYRLQDSAEKPSALIESSETLISLELPEFEFALSQLFRAESTE